jgi:hypothetical protein
VETATMESATTMKSATSTAAMTAAASTAMTSSAMGLRSAGCAQQDSRCPDNTEATNGEQSYHRQTARQDVAVARAVLDHQKCLPDLRMHRQFAKDTVNNRRFHRLRGSNHLNVILALTDENGPIADWRAAKRSQDHHNQMPQGPPFTSGLTRRSRRDRLWQVDKPCDAPFTLARHDRPL